MATIDLVGPTACEVLTRKAKAELLARLGPDPLRGDASADDFLAHMARSKTPIGAALLDQSVIAGVGNVYRAEVLHIMRIHPSTPSCELPTETAAALWSLIGGLLRRGVEEKRIVTTQGLELPSPRKRILRAESLYVYGQRLCRSCGAGVERLMVRARVAYFCSSCQRLRSPSD